MQQRRVQTPGWAAFDRMHREKPSIGDECAMDPDLSISKITLTGSTSCSTKYEPAKRLIAIQSTSSQSFSSVVRSSTASAEFPVMKAHKIVKTLNGSATREHLIVSESKACPIAVLKDIHRWADENVIEDILAAVNNDVDQASLLLKEMVLSETDTKTEEIGPSEMNTFFPNDSDEGKDICLKVNRLVDNNASSISHNERIMRQVPVEPDWEEDDVYLSQRKEAIKKMRAASQHSRAASNAYLRGDHLSAQQFSLRAQEEWLAANKLNAKAAEEILHTRNSGSGMWKLDLHGLHATEAVQSLQQHLERIELKMLVNHSSSDGLVTLEAAVPQSPWVESLGELQKNNQVKKHLVPQQRQTVLHVITGSGNHSKGQAALPAAIRNFLIDHGYRFNDAKAGVIIVHPKFRIN